MHYENAYLSGDLDPAFEVLTGFECRHVSNSPALNQELKWLRSTLANFRPDHIAINNSWNLWRYARAVKTDVKYHHPQWIKDPHDYTQIPAAGGECGPRAWFGRFTRRAFGLPVWGIKEPGHAAMTTWSPMGWAVLLGAGWDHGWWDSGRSGSDFLLETQSREYRGVFQIVLRGQWAAHSLGEKPVNPSWTPRLPGKGYGQGGLWNALMLYQKKIAVNKYGPPPPRLVAKSVVATKVDSLLKRWGHRDSIRNITIGENGTITIPAATASGIAFMPASAAPSVHCDAILSHNKSCIHAPSGRLPGFPTGGIKSANECCSICSGIDGCIAWNFYDDTCNAFFSVGGNAKINDGSCVAGGTLRTSSNTFITKSFDQGHQMLHQGGSAIDPDSSAFEYTISSSEPRVVFLAVNFSTWHVSQDLFVSTSAIGDNWSTKHTVPIFYTMGYWNISKAIAIPIARGQNVLRFTRNSTRPMAIKELFLFRKNPDGS